MATQAVLPPPYGTGYLVSQRFVGDAADVEVLRGGELLQLQVECVRSRAGGILLISSSKPLGGCWTASHLALPSGAPSQAPTAPPSLPLPCRLKAPDLLVPVSLNGALPSYLMVGGLVVNVLSAPFMFSEYGSVGGSPTGLQDQLWFGVKNETDQQVGAPGRAGLCLASCQGDGRTCWLHQR